MEDHGDSPLGDFELVADGKLADPSRFVVNTGLNYGRFTGKHSSFSFELRVSRPHFIACFAE